MEHRRKGWALLAIGAVGILQILWIVPRGPLGWDFPQFWAMARIPLSERADPARLMAAERSILRGTDAARVPAFLRPPVFALLFTPLNRFSLVSGYRIWVAIQFGSLAALLWLLWRESRASPLFIALVGLCPPVMYGIAMGQDAAAIALIALLAFLALRAGRDVLAGILFALCLYKYNLFLFVPVFLLVHRRYKALIWFAAVGLALAVASMAIMPPGAYIHFLTHIREYDPEYRPDLQIIGLRRLLVDAGTPGAYWILGPVLALACWILSARLKMETGFALLIAATLAAAYYVCSYDYTLALIPVFFALRNAGRPARFLAVLALAAPILWLYDFQASLWSLLFACALAFEAMLAWRDAGSRERLPYPSKAGAQ